MRKVSAVVVIVLALGALGGAQEVPQWELFAGYSLFHYDQMDVNTLVGPGVAINQNLNGWELSGQYNVNEWLGAVADMSGHYGTPVDVAGTGSIKGNTYNFLFGPQVNVRGERFKGFGHVLIGVNHFKLNDSPALDFFSTADNAFGMALGGGIDVNVTRGFAVRAGQFDYILTTHNMGMNLGHQNNWRFSVGVLFNIGER